MKAEFYTFCDQCVAAAMVSLGAGLLLTAFAACGLPLLGRTNAATRHAVWLAMLVLLALLGPAHYARERFGGALWLKALFGAGPVLSAPEAEPLPAFASDDAPASRLEEPFEVPPAETVNSGSGALRVSAVSEIGWVSRFEWWAATLRSFIPREAGALLIAAWALIAGVKMTLLVSGLFKVRQLKRNSLPAADDLQQLFDKLRRNLGLRRPVQLRASPTQNSALALGFRHPIVLLPEPAGQPADLDTAAHVIRHELAHVQRRDDWANLLQKVIQATLFFHPAVWWISKRLALEREIACDDMVLDQGGRAQAYALLLVNLASRRHGRQPLLAPGVSAGKHQLQQRIHMILDAHRNRSPRLVKAKLGVLTTAAGLIAVLLLYAAPKLVLAQDAPPEHENATAAIASQADSQAPQLAQADPAEGSQPGGIQAGPKLKDLPEPPDEPSVSVPAPAKLPRPPVAARKVHPTVRALPVPEAAPGAGVEERLDRVERMLKQLLARQNQIRVDVPDVKLDVKGNVDAQVRDELKRNAEVEKRAAKQAEKAMKLEQNWGYKASVEGGFEAQIKALRQARETLERQMEQLERQIEKLERQHERALDKEKRRSEEDDRDDKPKR